VPLALPIFEQIRSQTNVFSGVTAFAGPAGLDLSGNGPASIVDAEIVSGDYFSTLGLSAAIGRTLGPSDDSLSAARQFFVSTKKRGRRCCAVLSLDCYLAKK
jgi:hypothetical protein